MNIKRLEELIKTRNAIDFIFLDDIKKEINEDKFKRLLEFLGGKTLVNIDGKCGIFPSDLYVFFGYSKYKNYLTTRR